MNIETIASRIAAIILMAGDDEAAHSEEDRLRHDVLIAIAAGADDPQALAELAVTTSYLDFARWCA